MRPFSRFKKPIFILLVVAILSAGCNPDDHDDELPLIDMTAAGAFPKNCVTVYRGEPVVFRAVFTDNAELGSFSLEMHHNFDHHTHSTDAEQCATDPVKTPVSPFRWIENYTIPKGLQHYEAVATINIPEGVDTGMYHLTIRLTDAAGWQTFKGISVRIAEK
jgi:hypothetical protein